MKFFYSFIALIALSVSFSALALHNVTVRVDNETYTCQNGPGGVADPSCVKDMTDYCYSKTSLNSSQCFEKASSACKNAPTGFSKCVKESTDYCYSKTSMNAAQCFEKSLEACGGSPDAIRNLMDKAVEKSNR